MTTNSFSVATTVFVSLAICAVISYGVFYYFKQRISVIEKSQMEQARIMQSLISHGLAQRVQQQEQHEQHEQQDKQEKHRYDKEITITQSGLIEVSSDSETESDSDSDSDSGSESGSESESKDKWSIGDEIHQSDSYHAESFKKNVLLDAICIDSSYAIDGITIASANSATSSDLQQKKIISLNKGALVTDDDDDKSDDDDDNDDDSSTSSEGNEGTKGTKGTTVNESNGDDFELKIGYKSSDTANHLNYGNMSVSALRQLAKERGLGEGDLQKLKKKELVQLLQ